MSSINSTTVTASNGMFTITDANGNSTEVDLGTLCMMVNLATVENLDQQIAVKLEEMQQRNDEIATLTEFMSQCRVYQSEGLDDGAPSADGTGGVNDDQMITINGVTKPIQGENGWAEEFGITWVDVDSNDDPDVQSEAWAANIDSISSQIDMLNNDSQMDNIELQNLMNKRNNAFEMATQVLNSNNESVSSVLRNL